MEQILSPTIEIIYLLLIQATVLSVTHSMDLGPLIRTVSLQYMARIIYLMKEIFEHGALHYGPKSQFPTVGTTIIKSDKQPIEN